ESERRYFELLVRKEKYRDNVPKSISDELQKLNPKQIKRKPLDAEVFSYVSSWHYCVILALFHTPAFRACKAEDCIDWIHERLGQKISRQEVEESVALLAKLKFIVKKDGRYLLADQDPL